MKNHEKHSHQRLLYIESVLKITLKPLLYCFMLCPVATYLLEMHSTSLIVNPILIYFIYKSLLLFNKSILSFAIPLSDLIGSSLMLQKFLQQIYKEVKFLS